MWPNFCIIRPDVTVYSCKIKHSCVNCQNSMKLWKCWVGIKQQVIWHLYGLIFSCLSEIVLFFSSRILCSKNQIVSQNIKEKWQRCSFCFKFWQLLPYCKIFITLFIRKPHVFSNFKLPYVNQLIYTLL